jgi:hypothetical protein
VVRVLTQYSAASWQPVAVAVVLALVQSVGLVVLVVVVYRPQD